MYRNLIIPVLLALALLTVDASAEVISVEDSGHAVAGDSKVDSVSFDISNTAAGNYLVLGIASESNAASAVTFGGQEMESLYGDVSTPAKNQFFGLETNATGTTTVSVSYGGNIWGTQIYGWAFLSNVDTANPLRASGSKANDTGTGTVDLTYDVEAAAGDFAMLVGNMDGRGLSPTVAPADETLYSGTAGASFSGVIAYDENLADGAYTSQFTVSGDGRQTAAGAVIAAVPEPATMTLLGLGGLAVLRRRKK